MTSISLNQISRQFKLNHSTIYRAINSGRLSRHVDGTFDLEEVIRCFDLVVKQRETSRFHNSEELEQLRKEYTEYKRQATDRENWLKSQIDRMQTLLELKSQMIEVKKSQGKKFKKYDVHTDISDVPIQTSYIKQKQGWLTNDLG